MTTTYCGHCGGTVVEESPQQHTACGEHLALEPPRFCASCRRRMKVQVIPAGWSAECVEHGRSHG